MAAKIGQTDQQGLLIEGVSHRFGGLLALNNVHMHIPPAMIIGLIGPNGAGKTTLINDISGLQHATDGMIRFDGKDITRRPPHEITRLGITRTYQNIRLFGEMTVLENLLVAQHSRAQSSIGDALFYLSRFRREEKTLLAHGMTLLERFALRDLAYERADSLPYGDQRRLEMARALAANPQLILLDEPTAGMNPIETEALGKQILQLKADGKAVLVIEHDMALIRQVCDAIYVLNFGEIIAYGTPDAIRHHPEVIQAYLGDEASLPTPSEAKPNTNG